MAYELAEDRARVQTHLEGNMVVEAGAGTGKTTLLIERICLAVLAQGLAVEKVVALTFTEKAAAEIKNRLITALHRVIRAVQPGTTGPNGEDPLVQLLQQEFGLTGQEILPRAQTALMHLDRASIGTIHSFCADILRTFPLEAGLSPQAQIDAGPKAARLFEARWNTFLEEELGLNAPRADQWEAVLSEISLAELKDFARELCSGKIEQYQYYSHSQMLAGVCEEKSRQAYAWSTQYLEGKTAKPQKKKKALNWAAQSLKRSAAFLRAEPVDPPLELPPALTATPPKGWPEDDFEAARGLVQFALKMQPEKQHLFQQAFALVEPVVTQIRREFEQEGILSFDDLIVKTRNLVRDDLYVRRLLKEKLDVLFIDEFQDTDPVQGELLLFLAEEKSTCATRWQDVRLTPGKLVVVGDPKQSIYRFRGADITAYELFTQLILDQGGEKCFLRRNYRSTPDIVAVANAVCRRAMVQQTAFQPAYEPIFPTKPAVGGSVRWLFVKAPADGALADDFRDNQAQVIADWISQNVGTLTLANGEKLAYKDIAILSRASTTLSPYTEALRRRGIAFNAESEKDFFKRQEINDLLNFLRVVDNPSDKTALVGVLRSPLGGLSDEEIYQLGVRNELSVYAHPSDADVANLYQLILSFSRQVGHMDVQEFLEDVLQTTFLPEACAGAYDGGQTLDLLTRLTQTVQQVTGQKPATLGQFLAWVQEALDTSPEIFGVAPADAQDAVCVMTVHKSKGLDFPVVILADLSKKEAAAVSAPDTHLFSWQYNMHGLRVGKVCDANLAFLEEEQKKHERCEEVRILYVALTRAKELLLLTADDRKGAAKAAAPFVNAGLWPDGAEEVGGDEVRVPVSYFAYDKPAHFLYRAAVREQPSFDLAQLPAWQQAYQARQARYEALLASSRLTPSQRADETTTLTPAQQAAAEVGTVCHRALQLLFTGNDMSVPQALARAAAQSGLPTREKEAAEILVPFTQSALFAQLQACELLAAEMPFSSLGEGGVVESGVMDAVFKRPDGTIWVVDYKTDQLPPAGPQALVEKYRPQLAVYACAAAQLFAPARVETSLVLLRSGEHLAV
ncbi:MAG: UvrD-helicase domain-containing protein [Elusimicrobiaceae bacterium]|nr:UvrD-helicase domain-containing protein [Elusimicrobiaceae bacterium]